jgi:hypothetical protein
MLDHSHTFTILVVGIKFMVLELAVAFLSQVAVAATIKAAVVAIKLHLRSSPLTRSTHHLCSNKLVLRSCLVAMLRLTHVLLIQAFSADNF